MDAKILKTKFKKSCFIHIFRNPADVVYSLMCPKNNSYPKRLFNDLGNPGTIKRFERAVNFWFSFVKGCFKIEELFPECYLQIKYESIDITKLSNFLNIELDSTRLNFKNKNLSKNKLKSLDHFWEKFQKHFEFRKQIEQKHYSNLHL